MKQKLIDSKYVFNKFRFYMKQKTILLMLCLAMSCCANQPTAFCPEIKVTFCPVK